MSGGDDRNLASMNSPARRGFGASGIVGSEIAFGAMTLARDPELEGNISPALLHALERGINVIDTARGYPHSEMIVGATLKRWKGERPIISTKLRPLSVETFRSPAALATAYTPQSIRMSVEESRKALDMDVLDVVHLHQWFHRWTFESAWVDTLRDLQSEGKVGLIGVSAQDHEHDALLEAMSLGFIDVVQVIFNVFESRPRVSLLPRAKDLGVAVIARCALDSGGLTGALSSEAFLAHPFLRSAPYELYMKRLSELHREFLEPLSMDADELAVRFVLSHTQISTISLGAQERRFTDRNLEIAAKGALPEDVVDAIVRRHVWTKNFYETLI